MNLMREQHEALTVELQQRRTEQESLLAQRDDLNSQLQVKKHLTCILLSDDAAQSLVYIPLCFLSFLPSRSPALQTGSCWSS